MVRRFACDAVLLDLDGVLVDSTAVVVVRTRRRWAEKWGFDAERILEFAHGRKAAETLRMIFPDLDADFKAEELERSETENLDGVLEVEGAASCSGRCLRTAGRWLRRGRGPWTRAGWSTSAYRCRSGS